MIQNNLPQPKIFCMTVLTGTQVYITQFKFPFDHIAKKFIFTVKL